MSLSERFQLEKEEIKKLLKKGGISHTLEREEGRQEMAQIDDKAAVEQK